MIDLRPIKWEQGIFKGLVYLIFNEYTLSKDNHIHTVSQSLI